MNNRVTRPFTALLSAAFLLVQACSPVGSGNNQLTDEETKAGWQLLFDGQTTDGWHLYNRGKVPSAWIVTEGELYCKPDGKLEHGDLITDKEYENFDLQFEWKLIKYGNSGVFIDVMEDSTIRTAWASGPEYQLLDGLHPDNASPTKLSGCFFGLFPQLNHVDPKPAGEWNRSRIVQNNGKVQFYLNGVLTADQDLNSQAWLDSVSKSHFKVFPEFGKHTKGRIGLQDWSKGVSFRNVKIRELPAAAAFTHPAWSLRSNIYEVNVRQYTAEGTFNAFARHLDRLKAMGVETLWFMPVNPISHVDRKGSLGSYYAVADYTAVNPEFGTLDDFRNLVRSAHSRGMKVLIDWVPNHTGADNRWLRQHPDFYVKDSSGNAAVPYNWTDTRQLDYANPVLRDSMIAAMKFWVTQADIDGFRCDVAWNVPGDFWRDCIHQLKAIRGLFMLAEGDKAYLPVNGFDATYPWEMFHTMVQVAAGKRPAFALDSVLQRYKSIYPKGAMQMYFTSNHDENSSNGADYSTFPGPVHAPFAVFTQTMPNDIPLIYSGQEEPVLRAIRFFDKDNIGFHAFARAPFYKTLLMLRQGDPALDADAAFEKLATGADSAVYAFVRKKEGRQVLVILNFSRQPQHVDLPPSVAGRARDVFTDKIVAVGPHMALKPWDYKVFIFE